MRLKLLFLSLCICLVGCHKVQSASFSCTESDVVEVSSTPVIDPAKRDFPVAKVVNYYREQLKENIIIPAYDNTKEDIYFDSLVTYDYKQLRVYANNTTEAEYIDYLSQLVDNGWATVIGEEADATFRFEKTNARVDFYKALDYEEEPYVVIVFSATTKIYDSLQIMKDVIISQFGFIEEGDILEPDEQGIIKSSKDIIWDLKDFNDGEEHTRGEYLIKALHDLLALAINGYFPGYLFYDWYNTPTYDEEQDIAEVYLGTYNLKYVLYMYSYYEFDEETEKDIVKITFMAGPDTAFPHAFEEGD